MLHAQKSTRSTSDHDDVLERFLLALFLLLYNSISAGRKVAGCFGQTVVYLCCVVADYTYLHIYQRRIIMSWVLWMWIKENLNLNIIIGFFDSVSLFTSCFYWIVLYCAVWMEFKGIWLMFSWSTWHYERCSNNLNCTY